MGDFMGIQIRLQRRCYYSTPEYSGSFWGKYVYFYRGSGSLRLTTAALTLRCRSLQLAIPLAAIKGVGIENFPRSVTPFPPSRLVVQYRDGEEPRTIYLIPYESNLAPTWATSRIVASWLRTLAEVDELAGRVHQPDVPATM